MLIIGVLMGIGIGTAVGFGIANSNLTHLLAQHVANTTVTHSPAASSTTFTIPSNSSKGVT